MTDPKKDAIESFMKSMGIWSDYQTTKFWLQQLQPWSVGELENIFNKVANEWDKKKPPTPSVIITLLRKYHGSKVKDYLSGKPQTFVNNYSLFKSKGKAWLQKIGEEKWLPIHATDIGGICYPCILAKREMVYINNQRFYRNYKTPIERCLDPKILFSKKYNITFEEPDPFKIITPVNRFLHEQWYEYLPINSVTRFDDSSRRLTRRFV